MRNVRVGAMPLPSQQNRQESSQKGGRRTKGITMEDLKKQTAMRLAQEQEQSQFFPGSHQRSVGDRSVKSYPEQQDVLSQSYTYHSRDVAAYNGMNPRGVYDARQGTGGFSISTASSNPIVGSSGIQGHAIMAKSQQYHMVERQGMDSLEGATAPSATYSNDGRGRYTLGRTPGSGSAFSVNSSNAMPTPQLDNTTMHPNQCSKTKLPHGLTVQELKEMTKARLQPDPSVHDFVDRTFAYPSVGTHEKTQNYPNHHHVPDLSSHSHALKSQASGLTPGNRPLVHSRQDNQNLVGPPGFQSLQPSRQFNSGEHNHTQGMYGQGRDSWPHQPKGDTWETASVASVNSTIGSEYYGSESAYGGQLGDDFSEVSFTRSRSYPSQPGHKCDHDQPSSFIAGCSYFDVHGQSLPNRRRACTLSPRPGLLHLQEDRPMGRMSGVPELAISTFDDPNRNAVELRSASMTTMGVGTSNYNVGFAPHDVFNGPSGPFNRPRTSSAPTISSAFLSGNDRNFQDLESFSRFLEGDLTQSVAESVLNTSDSCFSNANACASVFRNSGGGESQLDSPNSGLLPNGTNPWASITASASYATSQSVDDETALAKNLGTMLRLSGSENMFTGDNFGRMIEPEVSLLTSLRVGTAHAGSSSLYSDLGSAMRASPYNQESFNTITGSQEDVYKN